jgi:hypothetical protein
MLASQRGLTFISNCQRLKEGVRRESAGIEPTQARPNRAGYASLNLSACFSCPMKKKLLALQLEKIDLG